MGETARAYSLLYKKEKSMYVYMICTYLCRYMLQTTFSHVYLILYPLFNVLNSVPALVCTYSVGPRCKKCNYLFIIWRLEKSVSPIVYKISKSVATVYEVGGECILKSLFLSSKALQ